MDNKKCGDQSFRYIVIRLITNSYYCFLLLTAKKTHDILVTEVAIF